MVAKEFGALPTTTARDLLDEEDLAIFLADPGFYTLQCLRFLRYSEAKNAFDGAKSGDSLKHWDGSPVMEAVQANTFALHKERIAARSKGE